MTKVPSPDVERILRHLLVLLNYSLFWGMGQWCCFFLGQLYAWWPWWPAPPPSFQQDRKIEIKQTFLFSLTMVGGSGREKLFLRILKCLESSSHTHNASWLSAVFSAWPQGFCHLFWDQRDLAGSSGELGLVWGKGMG